MLMRMALAALYTSVVIAAFRSLSPATESVPGLRLELTTPKLQYEEGEPIPVKLRFIYNGSGELAINLSGRQACRSPYLSFQIIGDDAQKAHDPALFKECWNASGFAGWRPLTSKQPVEIDEFLNDWLLFHQTGTFTVIARSSHVAFSYPGHEWIKDRLAASQSSPLTIEILPPDANHRARGIVAAAGMLNDPSNKVRKEGVRRLRFMNDRRIVPLLIRALEDDDRDVGDEARRGLWDFPDTRFVRHALEKVVKDKNHHVDPSVAGAYFIPLLGIGDLKNKGVDLDTYFREARANRVREIPEFRRWKVKFSEIYKNRLSKLPPNERVKLAARALYFEFLPCKNTPLCKSIIRSADHIDSKDSATAANALGRCCNRADLSGDLAILAKQRSVSDEVRSAALGILISTAPQSIDDTIRDAIVAEVLSPKSTFSMWNAKNVIGDYKSKEIGQGLLAIFSTTKDQKVRTGMARRIRSFGLSIPIPDLKQAFASLKSTSAMDADYYAQRPLLESIAIGSPEEAVRIIRHILHNPKPGKNRSAAISVLAHMEPDLSRDLITDIFHSSDRNDRTDLLSSQGQAWDEATGKVTYIDGRLRPSRRAVGYFVPELIAIYESDSDHRWQALRVLQKVTDIPAGPDIAFIEFPSSLGQNSRNALHMDARRRWPLQWKDWWKQNRSMYER